MKYVHRHTSYSPTNVSVKYKENNNNIIDQHEILDQTEATDKNLRIIAFVEFMFLTCCVFNKMFLTLTISSSSNQHVYIQNSGC